MKILTINCLIAIIALTACITTTARANLKTCITMNEANVPLTAHQAVVNSPEKRKLRFWRKVDKNGPLPDQAISYYFGLSRCWTWKGSVDKDGYGQCGFQRKNIRAHRVSYTLCVGEIPTEKSILHRCDNPRCVNPDHLWAGSNEENVNDMILKGRVPKGELHWASIDSSRIPRGENNGRRKHPERYPVGDRHWSKLQPEKRARAEGHGMAKMTLEKVLLLRHLRASEGKSTKELAEMFGICKSTTVKIICGDLWSESFKKA